MPRVVRSTIIDVPVDRLWAVVRDFNAHDQYHPIVATSQIERGYPWTRWAACAASPCVMAASCANNS